MSRSLFLPALVVAVAVLNTSVAHAQPDCASSTPVYDIQGAGHVSNLVEERVETCGVVTAVAFSGYYLQSATGDGDDATADGIFVSQQGEKPIVGTHIRISATVAELIGGGAASGNLSVTTLLDAEVLESIPNSDLPSPVLIGVGGRQPPAEVVISDSETAGGINLQDADDANATPFNPDIDGIDFYESLEGMRVSVANPVAVSAVRQFGRFSAEVFVLADNGDEAIPPDARTSRGGILLQPDPDNRGDQNPERIQVQFDESLYGSSDFPAIKVGDTLSSVAGVMSYSFGNFEVVATGPVSVNDGGLESEITSLNATDEQISLASYNVLNLSGTDSDNDQRTLIATQIVSNLQQPDIIALQEVQDNNGDVSDCPRDDPSACAGVLDASLTLQKLVDAITAAGGPEYSWISVDPMVETTDDNRDNVDTFGGASLGNIRNAYLYNAARLKLLSFQGLNRDVLRQRGVSVSTAFDTSRDPLEAIFEFNGEQLTIINNHFSSRFGSSPIFGGPQPFIQAGEENRGAQSLAMNQLVEAALAENAMANIVVLGDLNTFEFTDELAEILPSAGGDVVLYNLIASSADSDPYSFIFEGNSQALDHIFVSASLSGAAQVDYVHVNVDFPRLSSSITASDHEPLLAILSFGSDSGARLDLRSTVYSETAAELFWNRNETLNRYDIYRDEVFLLSTDAISFFDDSLQPNTEYSYRVEGYSQGILQTSESIVLLTNTSGGPAVPAVEQLTGSVYSTSALEIFWSISESSSLPIRFDILRDGDFVATNDGRSFFDEGLRADTRYVYSVVAFNQAGDKSRAESITLKTRKRPDNSVVTDGPPALMSLTGLVYSRSALELFWVPADVDSSVVTYQVMRDGTLVLTLDGRSFFDTDLEPGTTYTYSVTPVDAQGRTGLPTHLELTTAAL